MIKVSIGDALAAGFHLIRSKPLTPLVWGAVYLLLFTLPVTAVSLTAMRGIAGMASNPLAGGWAFAELLLVEFVTGLLTFGIINAAIFRAVLSPEKGGLFYLRLGADEGRQALVIGALGLVMLLVAFGASLVLVILGSVLGAATGSAFRGGGAMAAVVLLYILLIPVVGFVAVRFSLSGPMSFAKRRFSFSESWTLTRGNIWRLFGIGAVLTVIGLAYGLVFLGISYALGRGAAGMRPVGVAGMDAGQMALAGVLMLVGAAATGYLLAILTAPWAHAYRQLSGHGIAEVFSDHPGPWRA